MSYLNEKLIRDYIHTDPEHSRCFECGRAPVTCCHMLSLTFCCQTCSGILYQHGRVKSISSSNFTNEDILQMKRIGGNVKARLIWCTGEPNPAQVDIKKQVIQRYVEKQWYRPEVAHQFLEQPADSNKEGLTMPQLHHRSRRSELAQSRPKQPLQSPSSLGQHPLPSLQTASTLIKPSFLSSRSKYGCLSRQRLCQ